MKGDNGMDYDAYDRIMYQDLAIWSGIGLLVLIISFLCLIRLIKDDDKEEKGQFIILTTLCLAVILGTLVLVGNTVANLISDIRNRSYITVEGEFTVVDDEKTPSRACSIILPNGTRLNTTVYVMEDGKYNGCIVYSERSEKILCIEVLD